MLEILCEEKQLSFYFEKDLINQISQSNSEKWRVCVRL